MLLSINIQFINCNLLINVRWFIVRFTFLKTIIVGLFLTASAMSVQAELVSTDWKNTGDGLATLDTATGIEWLDLTQTDGMSINQAEGLTVVGSTFDGWRLPTRAEVTQMMVNAFPSQASLLQSSEGGWDKTSFTTDNEADRFRMLFGETDITHASGDVSYGRYKNNSGQAYISGVRDTRSDDNVFITSNFSVASDYNITDHRHGVYLVSDGGTTLDSQLDPTINENNVNYVAPAPSVETSAGSGLSLASDLTPSGTGDNKIRFTY
jgi:hypothetical protein